ncbi:hypothetical protein MLGJGCBP_03102 [Rhodococcus sp. T7]|nr:hypothetical protein MLGJGCBP_03102 [Rhodococcus sp. T7]
MHHHERRRTLLAGQRRETRHRRRRHREVDTRTHPRPHRRTWPIKRQSQHVRQTRQRIHPVLELLRHQRRGIVLGAENVSLPQGVVRILHRQRGPRRCVAGCTRGIGVHQVAGEYLNRPPVDADVVHHHHQHVFVGRLAPQQCEGDRDVCGHVESACHRFPDPCIQSVGRGDAGHNIDQIIGRGVIDRQHQLIGAVRGFGKHRPQRFVPFDDVRGGPAERLDVEGAGQPQCRRDIVGTRRGVEPIEEPHSSLSQGQGKPVRPRAGHECGARSRTGVRPVDDGGQNPHGGRLEQRPHVQPGAELSVDPGHHTSRGEGVAAEIEEIVRHTDPRDAEYVRENLREDVLGRGAGRDELCGTRELRDRQCLAVEFAVRSQRQFREHDQRRRHHVPGKHRCGRVE